MAIKLLITLVAIAAVRAESCPAKKIGCRKHAVVAGDLLHSDTQEHWKSKYASGHKIDWENFKQYIHTATCRCEEAAAAKGYKYFSLREFGECHGLRSIEGLENSIYCFHHSLEQCLHDHNRCVGAEEGAFVFEVMKKKKPEFIESKVHHVVFCEHRGARNIQCPANHVIDIKYGYYGRKSRKYCGNRGYYNTRCTAGLYSSQKIKQVCNGRQKCTLNPHNHHYGDPCKFTVKYLEIKYTCVKQPDAGAMRVHKAHFCEHAGSRTVNCGAGKLIKIRTGFYGRLQTICGRGYTYKCVSGVSENKMKAACDGKQSCVLNPHNAVYGDPCKYTRKYIEVQYSCYNA